MFNACPSKEFEIFSNIRQKNTHEENVKSFSSMLGGGRRKRVIEGRGDSLSYFFFLCVVNFRPTFSVFALRNTHLAMSSSLVETVVLYESRKIMATFMALHTLPSLYHPSLMSSTFVDIRSVCRVFAIV